MSGKTTLESYLNAPTVGSSQNDAFLQALSNWAQTNLFPQFYSSANEIIAEDDTWWGSNAGQLTDDKKIKIHDEWDSKLGASIVDQLLSELSA